MPLTNPIAASDACPALVPLQLQQSAGLLCIPVVMLLQAAQCQHGKHRTTAT